VVTEVVRPTRTRDPARKERILSAAADLVARRGYHAVGMADIGAAAGVTGPAVYRHFESKSAVLVALFDRVIDSLLDNAGRIVDETDDVSTALTLLVRDQVTFAIDDREVLQVYLTEINNLPEEDRRRLRRKQRLYLEEWVHVLGELRPELGDAEARAFVHAAVGVIQSVANYQSDLSSERLAGLTTSAAHAALGVPVMVTALTGRP
jgi:AcrR family transcriptional regulator